MSSLHKDMRWHDNITNNHILMNVVVDSIKTLITIRQKLRWAGHLFSMGDDRMPKASLKENGITVVPL